MPLDPSQPASTPKNRALDRLRDAVSDMSPPERGETDGAATPRGNGQRDPRELSEAEQKLSSVLGH